MKKIVLIVTLLTASVALNAQEKQNDATWEETIEFLKEYVPKFNHRRSIENLKVNDLNDSGDEEYYIKENTIYFKYKEWTNTRNLLNLADVYITEDNAGAKNVKLDFDDGFQKSSYGIDLTELLTIHEDNSRSVKYYVDPKGEAVNRLIKAFKHLAYLAKEKRKQSKF